MQPTQAQTEAINRVPQRQWLKDLELPPAIAAEVRQLCVRYGWVTRLARQQAEDEAKLQWFFGGNDVAYLATPEGCAIVAVGRMENEEFGQALDGLSREERRDVVLYAPSPWERAE